MRVRLQHLLLGAFIAVGLPSIYGSESCAKGSVPNIVAPEEGEFVYDPTATNMIAATVTSRQTLTASSFVEIAILTDGGTEIDVTSEFLPMGAINFSGLTEASAELDAVALGLVPGPQQLRFVLDVDGAGGTGFTTATRINNFTWTGGPPPCDQALGAALRGCFLEVSEETRLCYDGTGSACAPGDPTIASADSLLRTYVADACTDADVQSLGFGTLTTSDAMADRLSESCMGNVATIAARIFGGPHAKVRNEGVGVSCLDAAYDESASFVARAFKLQRDCVLDPGCDAAALSSTLDPIIGSAAFAIDEACPFEFLEALVGLPANEALARARAQSECMISVTHGDTDPLTLKCGPTEIPGSLSPGDTVSLGVVFEDTQPSGLTAFAPGVPTQVRLDGAVWGTRCGDGSDYAFWVELPASGSAGDVVVRLQGGGVCVLENQCQGVASGNPGLLQALDDGYSRNGIFSNDPVESDFANWTKVFLPYCNQDVFAGGGVTQTFGNGLTIERYGAVNTRAALRVVRNIISQELNDTTVEGYRPDIVQMLFTGTSAGGYGVMFNLHHVLDEERWVNAISLNDSGLGLDSGSALGIVTLGGLAQTDWATRLSQPPYCLETGPPSESCAVGPVLNAAHSERLLGTPSQQLLILSNQVDNTQINTLAFQNTFSFVNEMRERYCDSNALPGVRFFLEGNPTNTHVYLGGSRYFTRDIAGITVADWVEQSVSDPTNLPNLAEEGTLTAAFPGVNPFGCPSN